MPIKSIDLEVLCPRLKTAPGVICIVMPGGVEYCVSAEPDLPDLVTMTKKFFEGVNSMLAPLKPFLDVLDVIFAFKDCIVAIPDSLGPPPNPQPMIDCLENLLSKVDNLTKYFPQVAIPVMAIMIMDALIGFLVEYKRTIERMIARLDAIIQSQTKARELGNVKMEAVADCMEGNLNVELETLNAGFEPLQRVIGAINAFLDLAGLPCIPAVPLVSELTEDALEPLDEAIAFLTELRDSIPVPDIRFEGSFSKPCEP